MKRFKVAGYLRLSVEDGDKEVSDSIISQKSIIEEKIKSLGDDFELYDFYIDDGYTGLNTDRPNFQRMLDDIERKKVNCVITKDLSRLSRNNFEANYFIEIFFLEREIRYIAILDAGKLKGERIYCPSYNGFEKNKNGKYGWTYSSIL